MWCGADAALFAFVTNPATANALHVRAGQNTFNYNIEKLDLRPLYVQRPLATPHPTLRLYHGTWDE